MHTWTRSLVALALLAPAAGADDLAPALDFLHAQPGTYHDFTGPYAIPAGFFGPGSDPFTGRADFIGEALGITSICSHALGETDIVLRRPTAAQVPCCPSQATVPIELVALSLVSVNPITVTYNGGMNPEGWNVRWTVSPAQPIPSGQITVYHASPSGGTFDAQLPVHPRFEFVKVQPQPEPPLPLDAALETFVVTGGPWSHAGGVEILDNPCNDNFLPAVQNGSDNVPTESLSLNYGKIVFKYSTQSGPTPAPRSSWGRLKMLYR